MFSRFGLTLEPGERVEALGPLFYSERSGDESQWAVPPLFSVAENAGVPSREVDFLYPVLTYDRFGAEYRFQILQLFSFAGGDSQSGTNRDRFSLFPFFLLQRSDDEAARYFWLLPFYGHAENRFFRDEITFIMWPIYVQSRKRDVVTDNYLFPFFHLRHGDGLRGWQLWPLYGREMKVETERTNSWDDVEVMPGHRKSFVLWPFFLDQRMGLGSTNEEHQQALIPLYSFMRSPMRDSTSVPFILGYTSTHDRGRQYREIGAPWPLIVVRRGAQANTTRVWPFFSRATNQFLESTWYAWPIYKYNRVHSDPVDRDRTRILLFLYSDITERNTETGNARRRRDFWPLWTHRRDWEGNERLQVLAPLEPLLPNNKSIERNYSPVWSIWRSEKNGKTGRTSQSFFWNLYRRETNAESSRTSILFGLIQHRRVENDDRWRLFYLPAIH